MSSWKSSQEYDRKFKQILAMGLINNVTIRQDTETELVHAANDVGLKSTNSMSLFPPELGKPIEDIERVKARLREIGMDGILTVALIDVKAERYVASEVAYEPFVYYDRFRNYYYRTYTAVYKPGYYAQNSEYFLETNFYELTGGSLVWSGRSKVFSYGELEATLPQYAKTLFKQLISEGVIEK